MALDNHMPFNIRLGIASMRVIGVAYGIFCVVILTMAIYFFVVKIRFTATAVRTQARVVELHEVTDGKGSVYWPVYEFTDMAGTARRAKAGYGSYPPVGQVGSMIGVIYDPDDPSVSYIDSFGGLYGQAVAAAVAAVVFALVGALVYIYGPKWGARFCRSTGPCNPRMQADAEGSDEGE